MKSVSVDKKASPALTWEEESGLLDFLSGIENEVGRFNDCFGFDIHNVVFQPSDIDGDKEMPLKLGFILERYNPLIPELTYCLYSLLRNTVLHGYVGICKKGSITTLRELKPMNSFKSGHLILHEWLAQLVKVSCEKIMP